MRVRRLLHTQPTLGPLIVLLLAVAAFAQLSSRFLTVSNLGLVLAQVTVIAVLALGQGLVLLTAGIDLSIGAITVFSSVLMAEMVISWGFPGPLALIVGIALASVMGVFNGLLVTALKIPPFLATLGTLSIFAALTTVVTSGQTIEASNLPSILSWTGTIIPSGRLRLTYGTVIMLVLFAVLAYALHLTAWGKHVYATGDDREAARLSGVRTGRVLLSVYITAGVLYGIAAWILIGRDFAASPNSGVDFNLDSITAAVIGGISLFGGRGRLVGALVGALIVGVFRNGLQLAGVQVEWQGLAVGVLVLVAVTIDQWIRRVQS